MKNWLHQRLITLFFAHYKKGPLLILLRIFPFRLSLCHFFSRNAFFETFTVRQIQRMMKSQFHCSRKIRFLRERWAPPFDECLARVFFSQLPHKTRGFYRTLLRVTFIEGEKRSKSCIRSKHTLVFLSTLRNHFSYFNANKTLFKSLLVSVFFTRRYIINCAKNERFFNLLSLRGSVFEKGNRFLFS